MWQWRGVYFACISVRVVSKVVFNICSLGIILFHQRQKWKIHMKIFTSQEFLFITLAFLESVCCQSAFLTISLFQSAFIETEFSFPACNLWRWFPCSGRRFSCRWIRFRLSRSWRRSAPSASGSSAVTGDCSRTGFAIFRTRNSKDNGVNKITRIRSIDAQ